MDRVNINERSTNGGQQERVIPVQIERESRATERTSRQQERTIGKSINGLSYLQMNCF